MSALTVIPILIPLGCAVASLLARRNIRLQRRLAVAGTAALLIAAIILMISVLRHGVLCTQAGNWPAPFGITLVADILTSVMVLLTGLMGLATAIYSMASMDEARERFGYYPLLHMLLCGVNGAFLTGDLFNLYVWFEVMLIASFVLLALGGERAQMEGAIKYVTLNLMASALFLAGVGILYGMAGTLNMADLSLKLRDTGHSGLITCVAMLFLTAFGVKAALFPVFCWLPASYHTPPVAVSAIFAGLLTKVGVYSLLRVFTLIFTQDIPYTQTILLWAAGLTMVTGVLGAFAQNEFRRILSFHSISQIGYMVMGLGLFSPLALAGSVYFVVHHSVVKTNLFLISGVAHRLCGSFELKKLGGLYSSSPLVAGLFFVVAMSLAGMPPLAGFVAKFILARAGLDARQWVIVGVALAVGMVTLMSMTKIWAEAFWKAAPGSAVPERPSGKVLTTLLVPVAFLGALTILMGIQAAPLVHIALRAAEQILDNSQYIAAVLGEGAR
ncbi:MAG: cation:proton antiporter [Armatimonadota bacterium]|nr:MAG: cation:proton antiporter [Armatimonadota bacterium]